MLWAVRSLGFLLVVAVAGLGFVTWTLWEQGERQRARIEALEARVEPVQQVRSDMRAAADEALGEAAASYLSAANEVGGRVADLERAVRSLDGVWSEIDDLDRMVADLEDCTESIAAVMEGFGSFLDC